MMRSSAPATEPARNKGTWSSTLSRAHFFRKVPRDLSRGTAKGGVVSLACLVVMCILAVGEFREYFRFKSVVEVVLEDRDVADSKLRISFNVSMYHLPCRFVSLDIVDHNGLEMVNVSHERLTLTHIDTHMRRGDKFDPSVHDFLTGYDPDQLNDYDQLDHSEPEWITSTKFHSRLASSKFAALTFFSAVPNCEISQLWYPGWIKVWQLVKEGTLPGEMLFGSVNCSDGPAQKELCRDNGILGTPAIRVYHGDVDIKAGTVASDSHTISELPTQNIEIDALKDLSREYHGHRVVDTVADWIISERTVSSGDPKLDQMAHAVGHHIPGCEVAGEVLVSRAPGNFHLSAHSMAHTFDSAMLNASHRVNSLTFGQTPNNRQKEAIADLPASEKVVTDALSGRKFVTNADSQTIHHYMQVVGTDFGNLKIGFTKLLTRALALLIPWNIVKEKPGLGLVDVARASSRVTAEEREATSRRKLKGEYVADHSPNDKLHHLGIFDLTSAVWSRWQLVHQYSSTDSRYLDKNQLPCAKFSFDISPLQLMIQRIPASKYMFNSFWVSLCAIIGGVITISKVLDSVLHNISDAFERKPILMRRS